MTINNVRLAPLCALFILAACSSSRAPSTEPSSAGSQAAGALSFSPAAAMVAQTAGTLQVAVERAGGASGTVTVNYATADGTAAAGVDYMAAAGVLTWNDGDAAPKLVAVKIRDVTPFTGNKAFSLSLATPSGGAVVVAPAAATVTITGVSAAPVGALSLTASTYSVGQAAGSLQLWVNRVGGSNGAVSISYAANNGSAIAGVDFNALTGTLNWASGDAQPKMITLPVSNAVPHSGAKDFTVTLTAPLGGASLGSIVSATVTINGSLAPPPPPAPAGTVAFSAAALGVAQTAGTVVIQVARSGGSSGAVGVVYATKDGHAAAGADYTPTNGTLTWSAGETAAKQISIGINGSKPFTGTKDFSVALSQVSGGAALGTPQVAAVTITGSAKGGGGGSGAQIVVNAAAPLARISANQFGTNLGAWYDITQGGVAAGVQATGAHLVRWPGGSNSDAFHWRTQGSCTQNGAWMNPNSTFDNFMTGVVDPAALEVAVTVNYGSNEACNGGGDPAEAAAWVAYSKARHYNVHHWTVGNEVFGGWELDLHSPRNDARTYAGAVGGTNGYYQQMKNADSSAQIGVVVEGSSGWDGTVLSRAPYDFVELHWYAQQPGQESDSYLLTQAPVDLRDAIKNLRGELSGAGRPATPILIGEINSVAYNEGKQTMSIVNALFTGMAYGEVLNNGVDMATWWFGYGGGCNGGGNNSGALYGWQNFGGYDQVSSDWKGCGASAEIPAGVVFPSGHAESLAAQFAVPGNQMLSVAVPASLANVRAYAATHGSGYSLMLFNLDPTATTPVTLGIQNSASTSFSATTLTYGKAQYDESQHNVWSAPVLSSLGTVNGTAALSLPPYSITVLHLD